MSTIKIEHLTKHFRKQPVLKGIDLTLTADKIYGLLGRNGSGKSTLLNVLVDRIFKSSGTLTMDGQAVHDNGDALAQIFMVSEANLYPDSMKVGKILQATAELYPGFDQAYATELAHKFGLDLNTKFGKLSTGYHSIAKVIIALCVPVQFVILDEPTLGLDANHRELFYAELIQSYSDHPRTFILATHLIDEVANIISDVAIINDGQMVVSGETEQVLQAAHTITGPAHELDAYCDGLNVIGSKHLGNLKTNYVYGLLDNDRRIPDTVKIDGLDLQTLFIYLTKREGELVQHG